MLAGTDNIHKDLCLMDGFQHQMSELTNHRSAQHTDLHKRQERLNSYEFAGVCECLPV